MRNLLIGLCIAAVFVEISGLIWSSKNDLPNEAFVRLSSPPQHVQENPLQNGYFMLLGFPASPFSDPVQAGYEMWLEASPYRNLPTFNYDKRGRGELRIAIDAGQVLPAWDAVDPLAAIRKSDALFRTSLNRYTILMKRYQQWLAMPFDDWGFGHRASMRVEEIAVVHRLYVAEGFGRNVKSGVERLSKDLTAWRRVLAAAKTIPLKVAAAVIIEDDLALVSKILARPLLDRAILDSAPLFTQPLTTAEYSLRWPIQSQFLIGLSRDADTLDLNTLLGADEMDGNRDWLARMAKLHPDVFQKIEHPASRTFLGIPLHTQRTWETYAAFYDATIKASETVHSPLPRLHDIARTSRRTLFESLANPMEFEPEWDAFSRRLLETDARLRLTGLQIALRRSSTATSVPSRLAEVGPRYFDPFTGLPMLWSETQGKVYSVGKDGLDDGGEGSFDISVPAILTPASPAAKPGRIKSPLHIAPAGAHS